MNGAMIPRVPVDWDEACLRPYVSIRFLLCTPLLSPSLFILVICSGLPTIRLFSVTFLSFLKMMFSCPRPWLSLRSVLRSSLNSCSGYVISLTYYTFASCLPSMILILHDIQIINRIPGFRLTHYPTLKIYNPESRDPTGIRLDQLRLVRLNSRDGIIYFPEIVVVKV